MKTRHYFIDNLRWVTVLLVLVYHVFYNYNAQGVFGGIGGFRDSQWWDVVGTLLYPWFMTLMFVVAGASSRYALMRRTVGEFFRERTRKLLVPSTLGLLAFGWVLGIVNMKAGGGAMPEGLPLVVKFIIWVISGTGPLWFIQDLYVFSLLLLVARKVLDADRVEAWLARCSGVVLRMVLIAFFFLLWGLAQTQIDEVGTFDGLINLYRPIYYFVVFLVGYYLFSSERVHALLAEQGFAMPVASFSVALLFVRMHYGVDYSAPAVLQGFVCSLYCWAMVLGLFGAFKRWCNHTSPFASYMTRSSFGLYIVHMTVCTSACLWLKGTALPLWAIYSLALVITFVGSVVLWEVMSRIPLIRWCVFGIKGKPQPLRNCHPERSEGSR